MRKGMKQRARSILKYKGLRGVGSEADLLVWRMRIRGVGSEADLLVWRIRRD